MAFLGDSQNSAVSIGEIGLVSSGAFETLRYQDTEYGRLCSTDNEALRDKRDPSPNEIFTFEYQYLRHVCLR